MKVLFCGRDMHFGYVYTKEALQYLDPNIHVTQCDRDRVAEELQDTDVVIPLMAPLTPSMLDNAHKLVLIIQYGAGVELVDIHHATKLNIWVSNIPSIVPGNAASCAEMAIFLTFACLRNINQMKHSVQNSVLGSPIGGMLRGKQVLIIGFGGIAKELIIRLKCFGVKISVLRRSNNWKYIDSNNTNRKNSENEGDDVLTKAAEESLSDHGIWPCDTPRLAATANIIIFTCKQDENNRGMFNSEFIHHCKKGVMIVNVARGGLLDYNSVLDDLHCENGGKIAYLALDVQNFEPFDPDDPLAKHEKVFLTPHVAGVTEESYRAMAGVVAEEVLRIKNGLKPTVQLNSPKHFRTLLE